MAGKFAAIVEHKSCYTKEADEFVRSGLSNGTTRRGERSGPKAHFLFAAKTAAARESSMAFAMETIRQAAQRVAASLGLDMVDATYTTQGRQRVLCIYLEKNPQQREVAIARQQQDPEQEPLPGGVADVRHLSWLTHEDCAAFSRDFGTLLDVEDLGPDGEYTLEVSSPGLDRRLSAPVDFQRFQGALVKVQTFEPIANNRHWQGRLNTVTDSGITVDLAATRQNSKTRKTGMQTVEIAFRNVERAQLLPEI